MMDMHLGMIWVVPPTDLWICDHCGAVNEIIVGDDPGEYRCIECTNWL